MSMAMVVLIPAFEPDQRLVALVRELREQGARVVTVDDGSGPRFRAVFDAAERAGCTVIRHATNRGKGVALRSGLRHIARGGTSPDDASRDSASPGDPDAIVCADADGQHAVDDILRVGDRVRAGHLVLGTRRFTGSVPLRSRLGNSLTRQAFTVLTGRRLVDTQTGLRAYPTDLVEWLLSIPGDRYDYEMNVLLAAARDGRPVDQAEIATIYLDDNASSHFRPVADSLRVWARLLGFAASSLLAFGVDTAALLGLHALTGSLPASVVGARLISGSLNFAVNRRLVFRRERSPMAAGRYALLAVVLLGLNLALMTALTRLGLPLLAAKVLTETMLFVASYLGQRLVVFRGAGDQRHR